MVNSHKSWLNPHSPRVFSSLIHGPLGVPWCFIGHLDLAIFCEGRAEVAEKDCPLENVLETVGLGITTWIPPGKHTKSY